MEDLMQLSQDPPGKLTDERLITAVKSVEPYVRESHNWSGQWIAELRRRNYSWSKLVEITGIPQTTLWHRAQRFL